MARAPDWVATWEAAVEALPATEGAWASLLREALPPLLPGLFAAAGHGLLRVAHAVRALERVDDARRRRELALGLAYWSARYQTLPGQVAPEQVGPGSAEGLGGTLAGWPLLAEPEARAGLFFRAAGRLDGFPAFARAVGALVLPEPAEVEAHLDALIRAAAGLYVAHPGARVAYVHAVTIPMAVRTLLPWLGSTERSVAAGYALQATAALHALFGDPDSRPDEDAETLRVAGDWDEIRYHAACSLQEHAIKMAEACHRAAQRDADPILQRAAADAALHIGGRGEVSAC